MTSKPKKLTQPEEWWEAFQKQADKEGIPLAEWMGQQCLKGLPAKVRDKLPERPPANRPKKPEADRLLRAARRRK